jgi:hypothetical protein
MVIKYEVLASASRLDVRQTVEVATKQATQRQNKKLRTEKMKVSRAKQEEEEAKKTADRIVSKMPPQEGVDQDVAGSGVKSKEGGMELEEGEMGDENGEEEQMDTQE